VILDKVVRYMYYKFKFSPESPEFKIEPEIALELLVAANYLDM
jgi:hypothetical protein